MNGRSLWHRCLFALLLSILAAEPALAKEIRLGGKKVEKIPTNMVALPTIAVAIRTDDGGWKNIKIDAWVDGVDANTAKLLEALKNSIVAKADREFPNRSFEILQSAAQGSSEAKKVIHGAVEAELGHEWKGEVLIRNMLVY